MAVEKFYNSFDFTVVSDLYADEGITHIDMIKLHNEQRNIFDK